MNHLGGKEYVKKEKDIFYRFLLIMNWFPI